MVPFTLASRAQLARLLALGALASLGALSACGRPPATAAATVTSVTDTQGVQRTFPADFSRSKLTVLVFYADHCPCFRVHEARLRELASTYRPQGVEFLVVDSEVDATLTRDGQAARERGLPPIAIDSGAALASSVGAEYATYSVVVDQTGRIRYRGGIDSDKNRLTDDRHEYLRLAIDDLLAGREPRIAEGKTLGCALRTR